jgi:fucokinase
MTRTNPPASMQDQLRAMVQRTRRLYAARVAGMHAAPSWWTAVIITASSERQAERYESELHRRVDGGRIPAGTKYLVVPDLAGERIGSGGATLNALRTLAAELLSGAGNPASAFDLAQWWSGQRVLLIHSGGDSRRLPQYSLSGKLFSALPLATPWGEASTVFDEFLALSTGWAGRLESGLVVGSGDVILTFDPESLSWDRPGVSGVAMLQPSETGTRHGVYVTDEQGRIYAFLQKPSIAELRAAGGLLESDQVALDTGLLRFDPATAARLTQLAIDGWAGGDGKPAAIDLYRHVTMALTGQWKPGPDDPPALHALSEALKGLPFWCSVVPGDFTHVGTTSLFRQLMTGDTEFSKLYAAQRRLGVTRQAGVRSAGVVIDSVLAGGADLGADTVAIECNLSVCARAASGAVLHGLDGIQGTVDVSENTVVHQVPVIASGGRRGVVIRVYGVEDDPKALAVGGNATWFGRPMVEELRSRGMDPNEVWPGLPAHDWTLWNARLFPVAAVEHAWECARWLQLLPGSNYSAERWREQERLSLASSTQLADGPVLEAARSRRWNANWRMLALALVESGADIRPLLANAPGTATLAETGDALGVRARELEASSLTEAANRDYAAGLFFGQAGLVDEAGESHASAFRLIERAVELGNSGDSVQLTSPWRGEEITVEGPARIDLGGGWSDTPPFCLDWGGTVLNIAVLLNGGYPIRTTVRRLCEPVVRCICGDDRAAAEYRTSEELLEPPCPGDPFSIPRTALRMTGLFEPGGALVERLRRMGGGLEITTEVNLPMGSGLGTSSILAATTLRAIAEIAATPVDDQALSERVMRLEQLMTTGGGWQDQAGGIFPGAKLVVTGPGLKQRVRVQPVPWTAERAAEFESLLVLYYTGIRRVARDLLRQVVGRYLARETACVQVLHSIKTLASEMAYAMQEGDWDLLGRLLDRHWDLNQVLDPNTTNAPINSLLESVRPFIRGAKLAGAGGGGFLILLARSPEEAHRLRTFLGRADICAGGAIYASQIAREGLRAWRGIAGLGASRGHF